MGTRPLTRPSARRLSSPSLGRRGGVGRPRRLAVGRPFPLRFGSGRQSAILAPSGGRRPPEGLNGGQRTRRATGAALVGPSAISSFYPAAIPSPFRRLCAACSPTVDESRLPFIVFGSAGKRWTECLASQTSLWSSIAPPPGPRVGPRMLCDLRPSKTRDHPTFSALESVGTCWESSPSTSRYKSECRRRWCCPPPRRPPPRRLETARQRSLLPPRPVHRL